MSYLVFNSIGLVLCVMEAALGASVLWFVCFMVNLLLGGSIERKPQARGMARRRLLDELAAYERAKNASEVFEAELAPAETNPYAIPAVAPEQAAIPYEPKEQPLPVPRFGKAFLICFAASFAQLLVSYLFVLVLVLFGVEGNVPVNQVLNSATAYLASGSFFVTTLVGLLVLAALLKRYLPTKWWIAFVIAAIYRGIVVAAIFLFIVSIG